LKLKVYINDCSEKNMAPIDIMNLSFVHCGSGGGRKEALTNIMQTHAAMKDTSCKHMYVFESLP